MSDYSHLQVPEKIFDNVKYLLSGNVSDQALKLLEDGGGQHLKYFSDFVSHVICGTTGVVESDLVDANEIYEVPALTERWIFSSCRAKKLLSTKGFIYNPKNVLSALTITTSKLLKNDQNAIWAMVTYNGGAFKRNLDHTVTHLITTSITSAKYQKCTSLNGRVVVATPDWLVECLKQKRIVPHDAYHPRLIVRSDTSRITGFEPDADDVLDEPGEGKRQAMVDKLWKLMPWNQYAVGKPKEYPRPVKPPNRLQLVTTYANKMPTPPTITTMSSPRATTPSHSPMQQVAQHVPKSVVHHTPTVNQDILQQQQQQQFQYQQQSPQQQQQVLQSPQHVLQSPQHPMPSPQQQQQTVDINQQQQQQQGQMQQVRTPTSQPQQQQQPQIDNSFLYKYLEQIQDPKINKHPPQQQLQQPQQQQLLQQAQQQPQLQQLRPVMKPEGMQQQQLLQQELQQLRMRPQQQQQQVQQKMQLLQGQRVLISQNQQQLLQLQQQQKQLQFNQQQQQQNLVHQQNLGPGQMLQDQSTGQQLLLNQQQLQQIPQSPTIQQPQQQQQNLLQQNLLIQQQQPQQQQQNLLQQQKLNLQQQQPQLAFMQQQPPQQQQQQPNMLQGNLQQQDLLQQQLVSQQQQQQQPQIVTQAQNVIVSQQQQSLPQQQTMMHQQQLLQQQNLFQQQQQQVQLNMQQQQVMVSQQQPIMQPQQQQLQQQNIGLQENVITQQNLMSPPPQQQQQQQQQQILVSQQPNMTPPQQLLQSPQHPSLQPMQQLNKANILQPLQQQQLQPLQQQQQNLLQQNVIQQQVVMSQQQQHTQQQPPNLVQMSSQQPNLIMPQQQQQQQQFNKVQFPLQLQSIPPQQQQQFLKGTPPGNFQQQIVQNQGQFIQQQPQQQQQQQQQPGQQPFQVFEVQQIQQQPGQQIIKQEFITQSPTQQQQQPVPLGGGGVVGIQQVQQRPVWQQHVIRQAVPGGPQGARVQWQPGQQPPVQRQYIHLDAQTHQQLQQMAPEERAQFVEKLRKQRQFQQRQQQFIQLQQQRAGHILIRSNTPVPQGLTPQQQMQWLQQAKQQGGVVLQQQTVPQQQPGLSPIQQQQQQQPQANVQQVVQGQQAQFDQNVVRPPLRVHQLQLQRDQAKQQPLQQQQQVVPPQQQQQQLQQPGVVQGQGQGLDGSQSTRAKTALANMLSIRLSGGQAIAGEPNLAEPSAAGTLRLMTAQHNASLNTAPRAQQILALHQQQQQRRLNPPGGQLGPVGDQIRPQVPGNTPPASTTATDAKLQCSPRSVLPIQHRPGTFYGHNPNLKLPSDLFLLGCIFVVVEIEDDLNEKMPIWSKKIETYGGEIEKQYCTRVTHVLCKSQRHGVVMQALRDYKRCVTIYWLHDVLERKQVLPPWMALHLPTMNLDSNPATKHLITLTGFVNNDRERVKVMIQCIGASMTTFMSQHNTLVVSADQSSAKCVRAKKWGIPIVNVQWLTEVMLGNFSALNQTEHVKYQQVGEQPNFCFDPSLVPNLMQAWKMPINISQESYERVKRSASPVTSSKSKKIKTENQNDTENMNKNEVGTVKEIKNEDNVPQSTTHRILLSSRCSNLKELQDIIIQLGGSQCKDTATATHFVVKKLFVTFNLLNSISQGVKIVSEAWLLESKKSNNFIDETPYVPDAKEFNHKYNCDFNLTMSTANRHRLFDGRNFYLTPSVYRCKDMTALIRSCGGTIERVRRSFGRIEATQLNSPYSYIIIADGKDLHLVADVLKRPNKIVCCKEIVTSGIFKQTFEVEPYLVQIQPAKVEE